MKSTLVMFMTIVLIDVTTACATAPTATTLPSSAPTPTATATQLTLVSDGRERSYRLFLPGNLDTNSRPALVIYLHGSDTSGALEAPRTGLDAEAERGRFIAVYPDATTKYREWNAGMCCGDAVTEGVDDVGFISHLIDRLSSEYRVDLNRVYVWGHSTGGMMAYRLGCEMAGRIAAIASSAGPLALARCQPVSPVSVLHLHSIVDRNYLYNGGMIGGPNGFVQLPIPAIIDRWRELDGCSGPPVIEQSGSMTKSSTKGCRGGSEVMLVTSEQGTHADPLLGTTAKMPQFVLDFFAAHPKSQ